MYFDTTGAQKVAAAAPKNFAELSWIREQDRQSARIAAADGAAISATFYSVQDIISRASFVRNEWGTLTDFSGKFLQSAMDVTIDGSRFTVYCKKGDDGLEWSARCPSRRHHLAAAVIDAVQRRLEMSRAQKAVN
ncbi:hypothetical protein CCAX7_54520 [Capsulimonas corticalis]|uniref:Uncharacterized protein n=1 Tax=Capsulimonas corticalis TaxID=2219043 RepID=A0A402D5V6_9BACT|nr:hypothetical protein [Capsulimonas corticalis]BDI33401.1 hypothetical protein CCAX7_54520 [Capsulimonas corticalis]